MKEIKDLFEKISSAQPIAIALLLGALFIILGVLGGVPVNAPVQPIENFGRYIFFALGALFVIFAIFFATRQSTKADFANNKIYGVTLDFPNPSGDGSPALVESERPSFSGSFRQQPKEGELRLFVYDDINNKYWPQGVEHIKWDRNNKKWHGSVRLGGVGDTKTIIAALVSPSGQVLCNYYKTI